MLRLIGIWQEDSKHHFQVLQGQGKRGTIFSWNRETTPRIFSLPPGITAYLLMLFQNEPLEG
jgi:hypothetical protein